MMKNISNLDRPLITANSAAEPVFADLYEQHKPSAQAELKAPTPEKLKEIYAKAYKEGYFRGEREARESGLILIEQETAALKLTLHKLATSFKQTIEQHGDRTAEDMLNLALELAKTMVKTQIEIKPDAVMPVIKHVIAMLPTLQKPVRLTVHPDDAVLVSQELGVSFDGIEFTIVEDIRIDRGGCQVETESNVIDASNARRWKLLVEALGCSNNWFEGCA